ncbi:hypothetical protein [Mucilaginibacter aquaedulcis]|uniref:hypothetical protein n=1 Tax=Mucilaginibacter aquaedulcis TaxID=1187081 RepID=UPI0025B3010C|nr:hypothetical protein [Mucilaginibacter aquaedulcis]MDN3550468.1 hypothetical protein [Mucilaginibacter aquaedulcis]
MLLTELNNVYAGKKDLIMFLSVLSAHENFVASKQQLLNLQDQLQVQLKKCETIYELCEQEPMIKQFPEKMLTSVEHFFLIKRNENAGKGLLSLIVYIKLHESRESVLFNKIKNLAQILGYHHCLFILNQPAQLIVNSDDLIEQAAFLYTSKIAV